MLVFFQFIQIFSGIMIVLLILLHSPKGGGIAAMGGSSQLFSSQKGAEAGLTKVTTFFASVFIIVSILLGFNIIN